MKIGLVTTSFPLKKSDFSGIFVERLISKMPSEVMTTVLVPCPNFKFIINENKPYKIKCFSYGPLLWQRLAHRPGGIPDAFRRRDPSLLLLPWFVSSMFFSCLRLAAKVDLMHGNWAGPGLFAAIAARMLGRRALVTLRGEDVNRARTSTLFRMILLACIDCNHRTVAVSKAMKEELYQLYPSRAQKIEFIPNGVDDMGFNEVRKEIHSPLRFLTIGSCIKRKRMDLILKALGEVKHEKPWVLKIVGSGPEKGYLENLSRKLGIERYVEFVGQVPPDEVSSYLSWADVFVFASESEGRPNVILEAMSAGLPIVSSDIDGVRELILPDAGVLYKTDDQKELSVCLKACLDNPAGLKKLGKSAKQQIEKKELTWSNAAARYVEMYKKILYERN